MPHERASAYLQTLPILSQMPKSSLDPPFSKEVALSLPYVHPATVSVGDRLIRPRTDLDRYLEEELCTRRLDKIHQHLHYAGAPRHARPLHRQVLMDRAITITEDVDEHLVWFQRKIFIKPLNGWLLDSTFWTEHICINESLHKAACGFLLSYAWLINRESDFIMAQTLHLLPVEISWVEWRNFQDSFLDAVNTETLVQVSKRYQYGELRLSRLNDIWRVAPSVTSLRNFVRGYLSPSTWYQEFFQNTFGWVLVIFIYFTVGLAAMQLGLAQQDLSRSNAFQRATYGFTVFSLVFLATSVLVVVSTWFILTLFHYISAKLYHRRVVKAREEKISNSGPGV